MDRATKRKTAVSLVAQGVPRAEVAKTFRISMSTLDKWVARARRGGDAALADKKRNQVPIKYGGAKEQVNTIANKAKFRAMNVTEAAIAIHQELHDPAYGLDNVPSVSTIYNWIRRTEKKVLSNSTAYEKPTAAGQVDQVDSTTLAHDVFDEDGRFLGRGTVTLVVDAYTRYVKGYAFDLSGESVAQIAEALTHAFFSKRTTLTG